MPTTTTSTNTTLLLLLTLLLSFTPHLLSSTTHHHRHLLHQPLFPLTTFPPTQQPSLSPLSQPQQQHQPKYPFSSSTPPTTTTTTTTTANNQPFFPSYPSPPPPPSASTLATFPANISALIFPDSSSHKPISRKLVAVAISVSLLAAVLIAAVALFLYYRRRRNFITDKFSRSDSLRLYPSNTPSSDGGPKPPPRTGVSNTSSSEFLYLGTLVNSRGGIEDNNTATNSSNVGVRVGLSSSSSPYQKLGSPELRPLPPLPRQNPYTSGEVGTSMNGTDGGGGGGGDNDNDNDDEEEFFSPRGSSAEKESSFRRTGSSSQTVFRAVEAEIFGSRSSNSGTPSYLSSNSASPTSSLTYSPSLPLNLSPVSLKSKSPDSVVNFPAPSRPAPPPPLRPQSKSLSPPKRRPPSPPSVRIDCVPKQSVPPPIKLPPPPPPPPPPRFWETLFTPPGVIRDPGSGPPVLVTPTRPVAFQIPAAGSLSQNAETTEKNEETPKPKLKPLHWDKVRASSDRAMVWDQLKSSSFQLNEEMIETLFMVNASNLIPKDNARYSIPPLPNQENRVLDPKKSQNIAILLRALNVTVDEVCEALSEGNTDTLGTELLESLLKMAPSKEEERKLKEFNDQSPFKLGPAEKFLKAVLDIPFAFKRVDAMLYIANFDSEVEYLQRSFKTLEVACGELRNSRMFLKLLEAVLKTGNRMNIGTNRGDAHAFKLDTLLKLVDVRGTDGKTTLLHFVVQEIIKAEGSRLSNANTNPPTEQSHQSSFHDEVEYRKLGLQVVSGLSGELSNVKKAASMDFDVISSEVSKLASGITKIKEVVKLNEETILKEGNRNFSESMKEFLNNAEEKILKIQALEMVALSLLKEITEYFHGNSAKEEAHPFRIFMVVRDFLSVLDQVCKEVGKINERTVISSARQFPLPINPTLPPVFPVFNGRQQSDSSDDDSTSSS